jgi:protein-disulfide isomerase
MVDTAGAGGRDAAVGLVVGRHARKANSRNWRIMLMRRLAVFCSVLLFPALPSTSSENYTGHVLGGPPQSPVRVEVYSDFECPHCRDLYLTVTRQLLQDYVNKVCVVYHEFPLVSHQYAREAARYSEAASRMGRQTLLKVIDALYMEQDKWSQNGRIDPVIAKALSRDEFQKLKLVMRDPGVSIEVEKEWKLGVKAGINSTPTMFIHYYGNVQRVDTTQGPIKYSMIKRFLDSKLK